MKALRFAASLLIAFAGCRAVFFVTTEWIARERGAWIAIALAGIVAVGLVVAGASYLAATATRSRVGLASAALLPWAVGVLLPRLNARGVTPSIFEGYDAAILALSAAAGLAARQRRLAEESPAPARRTLGGSQLAGLAAGAAGVFVADSFGHLATPSSPDTGRLTAIVVVAVIAIAVAKWLAHTHPTFSRFGVGLAVAPVLSAAFVALTLLNPQRGLPQLDDTNMALIHLEDTAEEILHWPALDEITAQVLTRDFAERRTLTYVDADTPSRDPFTISVNPIDARTWGIAAKSKIDRHCYMLVAHRSADGTTTSFSYGIARPVEPCLGRLATPPNAPAKQWPTLPTY